MRKFIFETDEYLPHQKKFFTSTKRQKALVSGFGGGKSFIFLRETLKNHISLKTRDGKSNGWILYPTYDLAEEIFVDPFIDLLEDAGIVYDYNIAKHKFITQYGIIKIYQLQKPQRIVGSNLTFVGIDEFDVESEKNCRIAYNKAIARLRGNETPVLYITTTPEGFKETYRIFGENPSIEKELIQAKTTDNPHLPESYVKSLYENYDPKLIKQYVDGQFVNVTQGQVYYMFDRTLNHTDYQYNKQLDLQLTVDFNVNPMVWELSQEVGEYDYVFDEIMKHNTNTIEMAQEVAERYGKYTRYILYGDYSGTGRDTRSRTTDYEIIQQILPNCDVRIKPNPPVVDRVNAVNGRLCNANNERHLLINTKVCTHLTKDFEQVVYKEGKREIDKSNIERTHSSDNVGYMIEYKHSLKGKAEVTHRFGV